MIITIIIIIIIILILILILITVYSLNMFVKNVQRFWASASRIFRPMALHCPASPVRTPGHASLGLACQPQEGAP